MPFNRIHSIVRVAINKCKQITDPDDSNEK